MPQGSRQWFLTGWRGGGVELTGRGYEGDFWGAGHFFNGLDGDYIVFTR